MARIGYACVSTLEQGAALQLDAVGAAGCKRTYTDHSSGAAAERPELTRSLDHLRDCDTLVVWRLDRLGRSLRHLVETVVSSMGAASASVRSPNRSTRRRPAGGSSPTSSPRSPSSSAT
jgi:DNA invertase Pin-like site-specific DNA recombinase